MDYTRPRFTVQGRCCRRNSIPLLWSLHSTSLRRALTDDASGQLTVSSGWYQERRAGLRVLESSAIRVFWKVSWFMALHGRQTHLCGSRYGLASPDSVLLWPGALETAGA